MDPAVQAGDAGLVGGVDVGRPLQRQVLGGPLFVEERFRPGPVLGEASGKYGLPVIAVSTSAPARLNALWPETYAANAGLTNVGRW